MWNQIIAVLISFISTFVFAAPVYFLYKKFPNFTMSDNILNFWGKFGIVFILVYSLYFLFVCCHSLSLFNIFISNVMNPDFSVKTLSFTIVLTSCYGAYKGLEGLARASSIIMSIIFVSIFFLAIALIPQINFLNYPPMTFKDSKNILNTTLIMMSKMSYIPAMTMLLPFAKGNVKKGIVLWNVILHVFIALLITLLVGALGEYINTHVFPVYAATSIAEIGMFKRLDALYMGIFTTGLFVKISLFLLLFSLTVSKIFGDKIGRVSIFAGGLFVAITGMIFSNSKNASEFFYSTPFSFTFTVIVGTVFPLFLLIVSHIKNKKGDSSEKRFKNET